MAAEPTRQAPLAGCHRRNSDVDLSALSRKGALPALAALAASRSTPMSAGEFVEASGMDSKHAIRLREELHLLGIIDAKIVREQGSVKELEIRLTEFGRPIADLALAMREHMTKNEPTRGRTTKK